MQILAGSLVRQGAWRVAPVMLMALTIACGRDRASDRGAGTGEAIDEAPPPPPTLSRFDVPLDYDFTPILLEVERVVPRTLGSLDSIRPIEEDSRRLYSYEVTRGPFTTFMAGSDVHLRTTLSYAVRGFYNPRVGPTVRAGCGRGDDRPEMTLELVTPLTLSRDWHLRSQVRLVDLSPASDRAEDRCRVSILRLDVTDRVVDAARGALVAHLPDIDREIAKIDLTDHVTEWWGELSRPIRLTDDVWLLLQPRQLRAGRVTGRGHLLSLRVGLDAYPRVVTGPEPEADVLPLPPLDRATGPSGFHIVVDGNVDYATASRAFTESLGGKTVTRAGRSATVQSVTASPEPGGRLALAVTFTGDANGTLRFVGTPRLDESRAQIIVPDLDYDLETDSRLVNAIAWLKSEDLLNLFRTHAQIPVEPVLERGRALLTEGLNRTIGRAVTMSATVDSVSVEGLYVTRGGLVVRAGASGDARVSVRER
jgi:hypothetical protein